MIAETADALTPGGGEAENWSTNLISAHPSDAKTALERLLDWLSEEMPDLRSRLPSERQLAEKLDVSRSELRKALSTLEHEGVLSRQVGRGTYLKRQVDDRASAASIKVLAERTSPQEAMMARMSLEPELASLAAINASPRQLAEARDLAMNMQAASNWGAYETLDARFHNLIAEASGNTLLHELHKILNGVRVFVVWDKLPMPNEGPPANYHSFAEHDAILAALERHDRAAAHKAMRAHLKAILAAMIFED